MEHHDLTVGDICTVTSGKHKEMTVIVLKAGIETKYGVKSITAEYYDRGNLGNEQIWVSPEQLQFLRDTDVESAKARNDLDYKAYLARKQAGVPPASQFNKKPWGNRESRQ